MLRKIIRIMCILSLLLIINQNRIKEKIYEVKVENQIEKNISEDYIEINNYKMLIKTGNEDEVLNKNYVYYMPISNDDCIFLAGHNNKIVFNRIYTLNINDLLKLSINGKEEEYKVIERRCIRVNDYSIYNNETSKNLVLITCTNNNQKRYVVILKKIKLLS